MKESNNNFHGLPRNDTFSTSHMKLTMIGPQEALDFVSCYVSNLTHLTAHNQHFEEPFDC